MRREAIMNRKFNRIQIIFATLIFFSTIQQCCGQQILSVSDFLPADYDPQTKPPTFDNQTFTIGLTVFVNTLIGVNDAAQTFSLDMTIIQEWFDPRVNTFILGHQENIVFTQTSVINRFWLPDIYFINSRSAQLISSLQTQHSLTVRPTGLIEYRARVSSSFTCHMWLINYPHDWHVCSFLLSSLRYSPAQLRIQWADFDVNDQTEFPQQKLRSWWIDRCDNQTDRFGLIEFNSCAKGSIKFVRRLSYYIIRYYLLSFLLVCVAFVGFWVPVNGWPARANVIATPLFSLLTLDLTMNNEVGVNYTVSLHIWMMFLQAFLYLSFVEWAFAVAWAHMINAKKRYALVVKQSKTAGEQLNSMIELPQYLNGYYFTSRSWYRKLGKWTDATMIFFYGEVDFKADPMTRNKVDYFARIIFPFILVFFTFMYVMLTVVRWSSHFN